RNRATIFADIEIVYIPLDVGSQILRLQRGQIEVRQPLELRIAIGGGVEALAVLAELRVAISNLLGSFLRKLLLLCGRHIHEPYIRFVYRDPLNEKKLPVIWRPVGRLPSSALKLQQHAVRLGIAGIHYPKIGVLAIATSRCVCKFATLIGEDGAEVARLAIR